MGCNDSKLGSVDEHVKICKDRKRFIKQAVEHRTSFASAHIAYFQSLRNVSHALREYIQGDIEPHEFTTSYMRASGSRPVQVQETSPETYTVESYEADSFLGMNMNPLNPPAHNNPDIQPPPPQDSQWDFYWGPLSSLLDYNGYNYDNNQSCMEDEMRRVREEEGIPALEEDDDHHNMKATEDINEEEEFICSECKAENEIDMNSNECKAENEIDMNYNEATTDDAKGDETHDYTVNLNRRPTSMGEVIKYLEDQFVNICNSANEVSGLLEANKVQYSTSSRFSISSESSSVFSEKSSMLSGHQATLDRLYLWEKKLYDEVKSGEPVRIAYEKKRLVLRNHDVKGDESSSIDKTRVKVRDLDTQLKVSIHSIKSISARIETLRDQELLPQLLELLQGLARMWKVMAECHQIQKRTLDEAKLLLVSTMPCNNHPKKINTERLAGSALNLVTQLINWRACFQAWITSQRSYVFSLTGWLLRCIRCYPDPEKVTLPAYPYLIFEVCIGWSRILNRLNEKHVVEKLDFFASSLGSLFAPKPKQEPYSGTTESMELFEAGKAEKLAEITVKVVCHGMSVSVTSLFEFAITSADETSKLFNHTSEQYVKFDNVEYKKEEQSDRV